MSVELRVPAKAAHRAERVTAPAQPAPDVLTVDRIERTAELIGLEADWQDLLVRTRMAHPFVSHPWILSWWEAFGAGRTLRTIVVRRGARCVAIAPLVLERTRMCGAPVRALSSPCNDHTPRFEFLVDPEVPQAWEMLWDEIAGSSSDWDVMRLSHLPESCATGQRVHELASRAGMPHAWWNGSRSPRLVVEGTWEAYVQALPSKLRQNMRRQERRLAERGDVQVQELGADEAFGPALADGMRLESAGWKGATESAMASRPELSCFYDLLGERAQRSGRLALHFLTVGGARIAFSYGLRHDNALYLMKLGFEPSLAACSPSAILTDRIVRSAFEGGVGLVDCLGDDDRWKVQRMPSLLPHRWLFVFPDSVRGRLLHGARFVFAPKVRSAAARAADGLRRARGAVERLRGRSAAGADQGDGDAPLAVESRAF
jgi:CelD/BcsL family acetyltransferase involved in cellulose biosynthesis